MIEINDGRMIHLKGKNTSYVFRITDTDHLEHIHYGKRLEHAQEDGRAIIDKNRSRAGLSIALDSTHPTLDLNNMALEASFEGKGDFKSPLVKIEGRKTLDLRYSGHRLYPGIKRYRSASLPMAVAEEENAETVEILLKDEEQKISVILCYTLFKDWDIISRKTIVRNDGKEEIVIGKCASMQLDLYGSSFSLTSLGGAWLRELEVKKQSLCSGTLSLSSRNMSTGFETNSAFAIEDERGGCLISALVYSSSFSTTFEMGEQSRLHIVSGINSDSRYSGIKRLKKAGGLYLTYAGGDKGGYQETSTAQGWSSILTGKWGKENGVILHVPIRENVPTVLRELAEKGYPASFNASWEDHFTITYSREIEIAKRDNLPLVFNRVENDEELHEKIKSEITSGTKCIFAIYEAPDCNGHSTKFGNGNYRYVKAVTDLDRCVYEQLDFIESREEYKDENWLIIVTSDHGGHDFGHGKQITEDRTTFLACNKKLINE